MVVTSKLKIPILLQAKKDLALFLDGFRKGEE